MGHVIIRYRYLWLCRGRRVAFSPPGLNPAFRKRRRTWAACAVWGCPVVPRRQMTSTTPGWPTRAPNIIGAETRATPCSVRLLPRESATNTANAANAASAANAAKHLLGNSHRPAVCSTSYRIPPAEVCETRRSKNHAKGPEKTCSPPAQDAGKFLLKDFSLHHVEAEGVRPHPRCGIQ